MINLRLELGPHPTAEAMETMHREVRVLRRELRDLGAGEVRAPTLPDTAPGSRGVATDEIASLFITLQPTIEMLRAVVQGIGAWLSRSRTVSTVRLKIGDDELEVVGAADNERSAIIEAWLVRHAGP